MTMRRPNSRLRNASVLLELLISLALFVGAASITLGVLRNVLDRLDRAERQTQAIDLARAKMAELEAGLTSLADLRQDADGVESVGSTELIDQEFGAGGLGDETALPWVIDVESSPSAYPGLTLVELTVREDVELGVFDDAEQSVVSFTLRQLIALREEEAEEFEEDELLRGLPDVEEDAP